MCVNKDCAVCYACGVSSEDERFDQNAPMARAIFATLERLLSAKMPWKHSCVQNR